MSTQGRKFREKLKKTKIIKQKEFQSRMFLFFFNIKLSLELYNKYYGCSKFERH